MKEGVCGEQAQHHHGKASHKGHGDGCMYRFPEIFRAFRADILGGNHVCAYRYPHKQGDDEPGHRPGGADRCKGIGARKTAHHNQVCCPEQ